MTMSEPVLTKTTAAATYGGGLFAFLAGLSANEIAAYGGLFVAAIGLILNIAVTVYFKHQHLQIARRIADKNHKCITCPEREDD